MCRASINHISSLKQFFYFLFAFKGIMIISRYRPGLDSLPLHGCADGRSLAARNVEGRRLEPQSPFQ